MCPPSSTILLAKDPTMPMNDETTSLPHVPPVTATAAAAASDKMRAIVHRRYGEPDVLAFEEVLRPTPAAGEVLVRVHAAGASIGDHHLITGKPYVIRLSPFCGLSRPLHAVPGAALAGVVEAVGANVTKFRRGDEVFGEATSGAFAEYVAVPAEKLARKPQNLSFEQAAATPWAITALQALRDAGGLTPGQKVLINGASGGVGTWAVQIAKSMGADVTAVCSTRNVELVRALGADAVIDYTQEDFVKGGARFDLMLDTVGNRSLVDCRRVLSPKGVFVSCSGGSSSTRWLGRMVWMLAASRLTDQKLIPFIVTPNAKDLVVLKELVEADKAKPVIEHQYALSEVAAALHHVGGGHARGQVVIHVA
jgi:NADPH:quinone reductase-like Zn-dependent oxidoreductase